MTFVGGRKIAFGEDHIQCGIRTMTREISPGIEYHAGKRRDSCLNARFAMRLGSCRFQIACLFPVRVSKCHSGFF